jgi:hypothetical protein
MSKLLELVSNPIERARRQFAIDQRERERLSIMTPAQIVRELSDPPAALGSHILGEVKDGARNCAGAALDPVQDRQEREARLRAKCARQGLSSTIADRLIEHLES